VKKQEKEKTAIFTESLLTKSFKSNKRRTIKFGAILQADILPSETAKTQKMVKLIYNDFPNHTQSASQDNLESKGSINLVEDEEVKTTEQPTSLINDITNNNIGSLIPLVQNFNSSDGDAKSYQSNLGKISRFKLFKHEMYALQKGFG
jgi:membrane-bound ClpP family serine protease